MKVILFAIIVSFVTVSSVFAADFSPTLLKLSADAVISYDFDKSELSIPITVTGTPASVLFSVFTKDKANDIIAVQNGHLGWHYVNKIDTCVYLGDFMPCDVGSNTLTWDGVDSDGGIVPSGDYTYYLWAYDNINQKVAVSKLIADMFHANRIMKVTHEEDGTPKTRPEFYSSALTKITIGNDPEDDTLGETCIMPSTVLWGHHIELDPADHRYFLYWCPDQDAVVERVGKFQWVPNGVADLQTGWGDAGFCSWTVPGMNKIANYTMADLAVVEDYLIVGLQDNTSSDPTNLLAYITIEDGVYDKEIDVSERWFSIEDAEAGGQASGGPTQLVERHNYLIMSRFNACYREMVDPLVEDEDELVMWGNDNGDYIGDHNFEPDAENKWVCNDYNVAPYAYVTDADANLFSSFGAYDMGAVSFGLIAPDGTGIDYLAFAGETAGLKRGTMYLDYDSSYDGIYTDNKSTGEEGVTDTGIWFVGHDSIRGIITSSPVSVEDDPVAFSVAQNSPNPFNPATTISFTIPEAGNVDIEVFNVAGQKVDTIASEFKSAGRHSVTWDASGFSAGIYFYTLKSGEFSKTMKMTLLK